MAQGKTVSTKVVINNKKSVTQTRTVEAVVVNDQLVPQANEVNEGVNSRYQ